jgi:hypothetical protein
MPRLRSEAFYPTVVFTAGKSGKFTEYQCATSEGHIALPMGDYKVALLPPDRELTVELGGKSTAIDIEARVLYPSQATNNERFQTGTGNESQIRFPEVPRVLVGFGRYQEKIAYQAWPKRNESVSVGVQKDDVTEYWSPMIVQLNPNDPRLATVICENPMIGASMFTYLDYLVAAMSIFQMNRESTKYPWAHSTPRYQELFPLLDQTHNLLAAPKSDLFSADADALFSARKEVFDSVDKILSNPQIASDKDTYVVKFTLAQISDYLSKLKQAMLSDHWLNVVKTISSHRTGALPWADVNALLAPIPVGGRPLNGLLVKQDAVIAKLTAAGTVAVKMRLYYFSSTDFTAPDLFNQDYELQPKSAIEWRISKKSDEVTLFALPEK